MLEALNLEDSINGIVVRKPVIIKTESINRLVINERRGRRLFCKILQYAERMVNQEKSENHYSQWYQL
jgi:hypothetical protein